MGRMARLFAVAVRLRREWDIISSELETGGDGYCPVTSAADFPASR
jgi:hypothetical protein